jgi:formylglycine-generating enzyme required for sulfatase activity
VGSQKRKARHYLEELGNNVVLDMVLIPGSSFLMGSPADELGRYDTEDPPHAVTVSLFFMSQYPITQAQWRMVAGFPPVKRSLALDPSTFKGDTRPVENISWLEAIEFYKRLAQSTGRPYRLPTEAEWEYACRAGTTTPFYFGNTMTPDCVNYDWNKAYGNIKISKQKDFEGTTPVGQFGLANGFGLYDMHGNVWEWCQDHWHGNYQAPTDGSAWIDPAVEEDAAGVLQGGSWLSAPRNCRSAARTYSEAWTRNDYTGFRVVCSAARTLDPFPDWEPFAG